MASNLPQLWRFDYGDYTSLGSTFQKFLANLNLYTLALYNIVNAGIGFQNMQRAIYTATVTAGTTTPLSFANPLAIAPSGVHVVKVTLSAAVQTTITSAVFAGNWFYDGKNINILDVVGLTSGSTYALSLEVM